MVYEIEAIGGVLDGRLVDVRMGSEFPTTNKFWDDDTMILHWYSIDVKDQNSEELVYRFTHIEYMERDPYLVYGGVKPPRYLDPYWKGFAGGPES